MRHHFRSVALVMSAIFLFSGCSINKLAMNKVADILAGGGTGNVFTSDNDPEFVGDALPFAIKMYETLLGSVPGHPELIVTTGSLYIMYANAFLYTPASMMKEEMYKEQDRLMERAKNLYLRGRDIILNGVERRHNGFSELLKRKDFDKILKMMKKSDAPFLYWAAAGWVGAFAIDPFDMDLGITLPRAAGLMDMVLKVDPEFEKSSIHDFYVSYYGSLPEYMGGSNGKARENFKESIKYSGGKLIAPFVSLATSVSISTQNLKEFRDLLKRAVEFDIELNPENRLVNIINKRKAKWYLENEEDYFLVTDNGDPSETEEEE
ncbi:MAG: TRAP transporter TatT component family protein [Acidobacteriota bacterium]